MFSLLVIAFYNPLNLSRLSLEDLVSFQKSNRISILLLVGIFATLEQKGYFLCQMLRKSVLL